MTDIYSAIKRDHDHHRTLLDAIAETTGDSQKRRDTWTEFYRDVKSHAAAEEQTFYSKLISKTWGQDAARHSVKEHAEIDEILEELNELDMSSRGWMTRFKTLKHDYVHHMDEEEDEVFSRAKEVIDESEIQGYGPGSQQKAKGTGSDRKEKGRSPGGLKRRILCGQNGRDQVTEPCLLLLVRCW